MSYKLLEHEADVGVLGIGDTLEKSFEEGAKAMFSIMVDIKKIIPKLKVEIQVEAKDEASLFVEWLNELLAKRDIEDMFFSKFKVEKIKKSNKGYSLKANAFGEKMDLNKHKIKLEVKAATYSGLKIEKKNNKYYTQCVVDV